MQVQKQIKQLNENIRSSDGSNGMEVESDNTDQFLTFIVAGEEYGVDILCVQEIRGWEAATPIPNAPAHIKGVINLRGTIVPIIDLRQCFGIESIEYTPITVVIVMKVKAKNGERVMGVVVDAVSDVYALAETDMRPAPDMGNSLNTEFIRGLVNVDKKMVILLNIDRLLSVDDIPNLSNIAKELEDPNLS